MSSFYKQIKEHNGITFIKYHAVENRKGELASLEGKFHLEGVPAVTIAYDQYKYGDEAIVQVFNTAGSVKKVERVNSNYDRVQIYFRLSTFIEICRELLREYDLKMQEYEDKKKPLTLW